MREQLRVARTLCAVTTLFIIVATAAPFHFDLGVDSVSAHLSRIRFNPLISPDTGRRLSIPDFVQNLLLFVPFGAAAASALRSDKGVRRIISAALLGCALSVGAESIQLLTTNRISSFADVVANTIGTLTGAMAATMLRSWQWTDDVRLAKSRIVAAPTYYPMLATALLVCLASWEPFDVTLDVSVVAGHVHTLRASLWQASFSAEDIIVFVLFLLFGFMLSQWLRELDLWFAVIVGIAAALIAGVALETSQIFIASRLPTFADALTNAAGGVAGALVSAVGGDVRFKLRTLTVVCVCAAGIATFQWMYGRETGIEATRDIALCMVGAYVAVWSAARTLATQRTER